jgi:Sec7-like guanine-nucleotide exchange factor
VQQKIKEGQAGVQSVFYKGTRVEHVRPMLEVAWPPFLAAFSRMMESSDVRASPNGSQTATDGGVGQDPRIVHLCLDGIQGGIHIACYFGMDTERVALITALYKFTALDATREMRTKNIECIQLLLSLAWTDGNQLDRQWRTVLGAISQVERLHSIALGVPPDEVALSGGCVCAAARPPLLCLTLSPQTRNLAGR